MKKMFLALLLVFVLASVASAKYATYSLQVQIGTPERQKVKDALVEVMVEKGFSISKDSEYQIAFDKEIESIFFMNLSTGQNAAGRGVFTLTPSSGSISLSVVPLMVSNPGTGFELPRKITHRGDLRKFQEILFQVKSKIDGTPLEELMATLPKIGSGGGKSQESTEEPKPKTSGILRVSNDGLIEEIEKNSIAETAGLKIGDKIVEINAASIDFSNPWLKDVNDRIQSGRSVMVIYERNGERDLATLKK